MTLREFFKSLTLPRRDLKELVKLVEQDNTAALPNTAPSCFSQRRSDGKVLAHAACDFGRDSCLDIIARLAPNTLAIRDSKGTTPAWLAAKNGNSKCLRICAEIAPESFAMQGGALPLALAPALNGHDACLRVIAEYAPGVFSEQWDEDGATPAMYATHSAHADSLRIIADAAPEALAIPNKKGVTPERLARDQGHTECLRIIQSALPADQLEASQDERFLADAANRIRDVLLHLPVSNESKLRSQIEWLQGTWKVGASRVIEGTLSEVESALIACFKQDIRHGSRSLQSDTDTDGWPGIAHNAFFQCDRGFHHVGKCAEDRYLAVFHKRY